MNKTNKYVCIHGHFYQPPRENAWLEVVEVQDSAAPFHDWNERINFECYAPNTAARILDGKHYNILEVVNNYARMSFNFGPTLLHWMEKADPATYQAILDADKESLKRFGGHGSAIAQVHSHLIIPLCNPRDQETQIIWGIEDFKHRFQREPEGIWLAETAVDTQTLELLVDYGIRYTILAPRQAKAVRRLGASDWTDIHEGSLDPRRPYWCPLPSGRKIALFFYDGNIAQDVAFRGLLNNGKAFADRMTGVFDQDTTPQLSHIATDGESYGHHHRYGEMALADSLIHIEKNGKAKLTNYGQFLELFPPDWEAQIHDNSSWSCVHGVERWRSNCGCNTGGHPGWTQAWRGPLRNTLNWLRDNLVNLFEKEAAQYLSDPWSARNDYIHVLLDRSDASVEDFLSRNTSEPLHQDEKVHVLRLMEMQRNALLMFTSCGWFFDEISGLETNQILQYANRAIYYAIQTTGQDFHQEFIRRLELAPSNVYENGAVSYKENVIPARVDLARVGMHYAVASLFEPDPTQLPLFNYTARSEHFERIEAGVQTLAVGRVIFQSRITFSERRFNFAVLYLGQQNIIGNITDEMEEETFLETKERLVKRFRSSNLADTIGWMQDFFGPQKFSIWHLFRDEKRKILARITQKSLESADRDFRDIYNNNYQLMAGLLETGIQVPDVYLSTIQYVVNKDLLQFFQSDYLLIRELKRLARELERWNLPITHQQTFRLVASERIFREITRIKTTATDAVHLESLNTVLETLRNMGIELDIWKSQNQYFSLAASLRDGRLKSPSEAWKAAFVHLGEQLKVKVALEH